MQNTTPAPENDSISVGFREVRRLISFLIFASVFIPLLVITTIIGLAAVAGASHDIVPQAVAGVLMQLKESTQIASLIANIWSFVQSVLIIIVLAVVFRWLLSIPDSGFAAHLRSITADTHSVLALAIILTLCASAMMYREVPKAVENIGLVVIGYYFGKIHTAVKGQ